MYIIIFNNGLCRLAVFEDGITMLIHKFFPVSRYFYWFNINDYFRLFDRLIDKIKLI